MRTSLAAIAQRFLRWEFVPEAVLFVGLTAFFLHQNDAAASAFKSTKAVAIMAAVTLGWFGARVVLARLVPFALARAAVFSLAAAVALAVVVVPAYDNDTVIESFPMASAQTTPSVPAATPPMPPPAELAAPMATQPAPVAAQKTPAPAPTTSTTVAVASAAEPPTTPSTTAPTPAEVAPATAPEPSPAPAASGPQRLRSGSLRGIDHRAEGTVAIYRQPDGRYVIGLEDIDIQPGPDYDLYLVPGPDRDDLDGATRLDDLRGNKGTQYYAVPAGLDGATAPWTVLVWCETFDVPIAAATPA